MKNKLLAYHLLFFCAALSAYAENITTTDGKKYEGVTITRIDPNGLVVESAVGIEKIPFSKLPEEIQKKYGYNPVVAAKFEEDIRQSNLKRVAAQQSAKNAASKSAQVKARSATIHVTISNVEQFGAIVTVDQSEGNFASELPNGSLCQIFVKGLKGVAEGERFIIIAYREGSQPWAGSYLQKWICISSKRKPHLEPPVEIYGHPSGSSLQRMGGG